MVDKDQTHIFREIKIYRRMLVIAGIVYLIWWYAVELILPEAFNPFFGRSLVVLTFFAVFILSYFSEWIRNNLRVLSIVCLWILTTHYFYLFYENAGEVNWIVGSFITVMAINFFLLSNVALVSYSIFVFSICIGLSVLLPEMIHSVFIPGLITIIVQANVGLRSRLSVIKSLGDSNERFQLLFNSTFEGIFVHEKSVITNVNQAFVKLTGYTEAELIGKNAFKLIHPSQIDYVAEKMRLADTSPYETKAILKNGTTIDIEMRAKNFKYEDSVARLVTVHEITDRKRAEKERVYALTMAENVRVRDEFISIASHELKTPISSLKLQTQLIQRELKKENTNILTADRVKEFISVFDRQVNRLTELVETMLDVSRISSGRLVIEKKDVDLATLVRDVVAGFQGMKTSPNALTPPEITLVAPEHLEISVDQSRIKQVLENLITNAIKYGNGTPIKIDISTTMDNAVVTIEDKGLGIAPEYIDRIFNRFERAISAQNISGMGLGLYITRQIVEAHGGTIAVKSELGVGSTFIVSLPLGNAKTNHQKL